jgi:hypothetical protein
MAKSAETRDRYKIFFHVNPEAMGPVVAILTKMGFQDISYELITDVKQFNKQKSYERTARETIFAALKDGEPHSNTELREAMAVDGRDSGPGTPLAQMTKDGHVKKVGYGMYQITRAGMTADYSGKPRGTRPVVADAAIAKLPKVRAQKRFEISGRESLMKLMADGAGHSIKQLGAAFVAEGRLANSVSPNIDFMMKKGTAKRVGEGVYRLTTKGLKMAGAPNLAPIGKRAKAGANSGRTMVLFALNEGPKTWAQLVQHFQDQGREKSTLKSAIDGLRKKKVITLAGETYQVRETKAAGAAVANAMVNGTGAEQHA